MRQGQRLLPAITLTILFVAHLSMGANQLASGQALTAILALVLAVSLLSPRVRSDLMHMRHIGPPLLLLGAVLSVALLSQTNLIPSAGREIWLEVGLPPAATINRSATWIEIVKLCGLACVFALGALGSISRSRGRAFVELIVGIGAAYALVALALFFAGFQSRIDDRLTGGFLSANSGATLFGVLAVLCVSVLLRSWRRFRSNPTRRASTRFFFCCVALVLFAACLALTASRMGAASTLVAVATLLAWETVSSKSRLASLIAAGLVTVMIAALFVVGLGNTLLSRMDALNTDAVNRAAIFGAHWQAFLKSPLMGYGLGSFTDVNNYVMTPDNYGALWSIRAAHNVFIQWLEEAGLLGALPMFALIAFVIWTGVTRLRTLRSSQTVVRGLVASNMVILLHGTTDYALQVPSIAAFWALLLGLQLGFGQRQRQ
jgi:O-antigen ligase